LSGHHVVARAAGARAGWLEECKIPRGRVMGSRGQTGDDDRDALRVLRERVERLEQENAQLRTSEERLQILFEHAPDAYYLSDLKGMFVDGNAGAERITGYEKGELVGKSFLKLKLLSAGDLLRAASLLAKNLLGRSTGPDEFTLTRKNGTPVQVEIQTHPVRIGNRRFVLGIARDISARKQIEKALRASEEKFRTLFDEASDGIALADADTGTILDCNPALCRVVERDKAELVGQPQSVLHPPRDDVSGATSTFRQHSAGDAGQPLEESIVAKSGKLVPVEIRAAHVEIEGRTCLLGMFRDITERKRFEEQLARMARRDPLTGALNRYALEELLEREAGRSGRYAHSVGFLMIDVNRFKEINDRFGHGMGDKVLRAVAEVIQHNVRDADILVRYGGDEFLVILPETNGEADVVKGRILAEVARRNEANPLLEFPVTLAIGSAHWSPGSGQTMEQTLAETDKLMYEDKRRSPAST